MSQRIDLYHFITAGILPASISATGIMIYLGSNSICILIWYFAICIVTACRTASILWQYSHLKAAWGPAVRGPELDLYLHLILILLSHHRDISDTGPGCLLRQCYRMSAGLRTTTWLMAKRTRQSQQGQLWLK